MCVYFVQSLMYTTEDVCTDTLYSLRTHGFFLQCCWAWGPLQSGLTADCVTVSGVQVGVSLGVLLEYAVGSVVTWRLLAGLSAAVPALALLLTLLTPESPAWLVSRGRHEDAKAALLRVRGEACDVQREIDDMRAFAERNNVVRARAIRPMVWKIYAYGFGALSVRNMECFSMNI